MPVAATTRKTVMFVGSPLIVNSSAKSAYISWAETETSIVMTFDLL